MAIALSQIQSPVDDPNALTQSTQPITKPAATVPTALPPALPASTQPAGTSVPVTPPPITSAPTALSSVTPTTPQLTMPGGSTQPAGTATPPPAVGDAPPAPAPTTSAPAAPYQQPGLTSYSGGAAVPGLPAGFTMGDPNSSNYGSSYYNGQKVIGNSGGFWQLADGTQGPAYNPADEQKIVDAANAAYLGSAGKPGASYMSALDPNNSYTSPEVRTLLQDPAWQAVQNTGPIYLNQFSPETQAEIKKIPNLYNDLQLNAGYTPPGSPAAAGGSAGGAGGSTGLRSITPGAANDVGTPSQGLGGLLAQLGAGGTSASPGSPATGAGTPSSGLGTALAGLGIGQGGQANNGGVNLTPTTAGNALTNQTISPGPATDRFKIAQDQYDAAQQASQPGYDASLRDANRHAFGQGRGVSGQLRTSLGDLAANRATELDSQRRGFLDNALTGSIQDAYNNLGIAQQQQGFQNTQQQEAFGNAIQQALAQEQLTNGAFGRSAATEQAGYANDPSQIALILSQIFGSQATGAGNAASGLFNQQGQASNGSNDALLQYLLSQLGHGGSTQPAGTSTPAGAG